MDVLQMSGGYYSFRNSKIIKIVNVIHDCLNIDKDLRLFLIGISISAIR